MFDAIEAINDIIDDINDEAMEYAESCYEEIYDELCYRVESGDLTLEEAEIVNQAAYEKYVNEAYGDRIPNDVATITSKIDELKKDKNQFISDRDRAEHNGDPETVEYMKDCIAECERRLNILFKKLKSVNKNEIINNKEIGKISHKLGMRTQGMKVGTKDTRRSGELDYSYPVGVAKRPKDRKINK